MALVHADFVEETCTCPSAGQANLALTGATTGNRAFNAASEIADGDEVIIAIKSAVNGFEVSRGTFTAPSTLSRDTLHASSTGTWLDLSSGTHTVYCTFSSQGAARAYNQTLFGSIPATKADGTEKSIPLSGTAKEMVHTLSGTTPTIDPSNGGIQTWEVPDQSCTPSGESLENGQTVTLLATSAGTSSTVDWVNVVDVSMGSVPSMPAGTDVLMIVLTKVGGLVYAVWVEP